MPFLVSSKYKYCDFQGWFWIPKKTCLVTLIAHHSHNTGTQNPLDVDTKLCPCSLSSLCALIYDKHVSVTCGGISGHTAPQRETFLSPEESCPVWNAKHNDCPADRHNCWIQHSGCPNHTAAWWLGQWQEGRPQLFPRLRQHYNHDTWSYQDS